MMGENVKLLEVTKDVAHALKVGDVMTIRGDLEENAVLCSSNKTFDIKEAETSNSLLLLDKVVLPDNVDKSQSTRSLASASVGGVFYKYLEILEIRPKLRKLKDELSKNLFSQDSKRESTKGKTFEDLLDIIQASDEELKHGLKYYESVQVDGEWFLLDQDYQMIVLSRILKYFDENSWNLDNVHKTETGKTEECYNSDYLMMV